jgi:hypothetical protein
MLLASQRQFFFEVILINDSATYKLLSFWVSWVEGLSKFFKVGIDRVGKEIRLVQQVTATSRPAAFPSSGFHIVSAWVHVTRHLDWVHTLAI